MKKNLLLFAIVQFGLMLNVFAQVDVVSSGGAGSGSYPTVKAAFDDINAGILTGTITVNITASTTESSTALLYASGNGATSYTSVLILPSGGAWTISGNIAGSPLIDLNGADNVKIDGLNTGGNALTLSNASASGTAGTSTVRFINDATADTVTNCSVLGSSVSAGIASVGATIVFHNTYGTSGNDNNAITYCNIGPAGNDLPTKAIQSLGTTTNTTLNNSGITVSNNNIYDYFYAAAGSAGIFLGNGNRDWNISGNRFYQTDTRTQTTFGIHAPVYVSGANGNVNHTIAFNIIGYSNAAGTGTYTISGVGSTQFIGIYYGNVTGGAAASIQGNLITNIAMTGPLTGTGASSSFIGISMIAGAANIGTVSSNTIGSLLATGAITVTGNATSTCEVIGVYIGSSSNCTVANNAIGGITASGTNTGAMNISGIRTASGTVTHTLTTNTIGGTDPNTIHSFSTAAGTQVFGIVIGGAASVTTGNTVQNLNAAGGTGTTIGASVIGILVNATTSSQTISQNNIYGLGNSHPTAAVTVTGIYYGSTSANSTVNRNFIHSLNTASSAGTIHGIYANGGTVSYTNNMVHLGIDASGADITNNVFINGIYDVSGTNNYYYNSVYIGGQGITSGTSGTYAFYSSVTNNLRRVVNNSFYNARSNNAAAGKHYAVRIAGTIPNPTGLTMNNNLIYTSGTGGVLGYYNGADVVDLAAWTTAVGLNAASLSTDPLYTTPAGSAASLDLAPASGSPLMNAGIPVAGIAVDILGNVRNTLTPTIGVGETSAPLPVDLIRFTADKQQNHVVLNWVTATEHNNDYFTVQRSTDGNIFNTIGKVKGRGTTSQVSSYNYRDAESLTGASTVYYRLVQVDVNRKQYTSAIIVVSQDKRETGSMQITPNPFVSTITIRANAVSASTGTLQVIDMQGKVVLEKTVDLQEGTNHIAIDELGNSAYKGMYFVYLVTPAETLVQKVIKTN